MSPTAGTIFHATRTPLTVWFVAAWHMTSQKHGISALGLKRVLGIGSEQTVWAMLHRFRTAMVRPGRERLGGTVEVDETFLGGPEPGRPGRGALGKTMVEVAVEQDGTRVGRCRLTIIDDAGAAALRAFLLAHVEPGSVVLSDGWPAYPAACGEDYRHEPLVIRGSGLPGAIEDLPRAANEKRPCVDFATGCVARTAELSWVMEARQRTMGSEQEASLSDLR